MESGEGAFGMPVCILKAPQLKRAFFRAKTAAC